MSREQHHTYNHINVHLANVRPSQHLVQNQLDRSTSRRFQSVNLSLNPTISSHKSELEYEDVRKRHGETIEASKEHEIYFNRAKKYNYMKQIIDKYFEENKKEKQVLKGVNPEISINKNLRTLIPKINRQKEEKQEDSRMENHEEKQKVRQSLLNKRKNKIVIQKEEEQELRNSVDAGKVGGQKQGEEGLSKAMSFCSTKAINLPPIDQMFQDKDDQMHDFQYQSISIINESSMDHAKEDKTLIHDNEIYYVEAVSINGKIHHHIKTFKEKGQEILKRQIRATSHGVQSIWIQYRYDPRCLVSPPYKSMKQLLFKAKRLDAQAKFYTLKPKKLYKRLITNDCQELIRLVRQFCEFMKKFQGKILNNKINTSNLFIGKSENIRIGEWGFASFKETHLIQNMQFQNRIEPIVKSQKEWFVPPEYLAPQILKAIVLGEDIDLMSFGSASDIWSFGVALLQTLTIIPVWIQQKCNIYGKQTPPRTGLLSIGDRDLKKLLKRQQKFVYLVTKLLQEQFAQDHFNPKLMNVILKCIEFQPQNRPSFDQIIQLLK